MYSITDDISFPKSLFDLGHHLDLSDQEASYARWDQLKSDVLVCHQADPKARFDALLHLLYQEMQFKQADADYFSLQALDLGNVLQTKTGHALSLAALVQMLAQEIDLDVSLHMLPVDIVMSLDVQDQRYYFSPLTGREMSERDVLSLIRAEEGSHATLQPEYEAPAVMDEIMLRMICDMKSAALLHKKNEVGFYLCNVLVDWQGRHPHWIRERAFIAQQMGCISFAQAELEMLIEEEPDDPLLDLVKYRLHEMRHQHNVFH